MSKTFNPFHGSFGGAFKGPRSDMATANHPVAPKPYRPKSQGKVSNSGNSAGVKKEWEVRKGGTEYSDKHAEQVGHHGDMAAEVTGGKHTGSYSFKGQKSGGYSTFHTVEHSNPGQAAMDFRDFATGDGAQGASGVSTPSSVPDGYRVSYSDDNNEKHHINFKSPKSGSNFEVKKVKFDGGGSDLSYEGEDHHGSKGYARHIVDSEGTHHIFAFTPNGVQKWGVNIPSHAPDSIHQHALKEAKKSVE